MKRRQFIQNAASLSVGTITTGCAISSDAKNNVLKDEVLRFMPGIEARERKEKRQYPVPDTSSHLWESSVCEIPGGKKITDFNVYIEPLSTPTYIPMVSKLAVSEDFLKRTNVPGFYLEVYLSFGFLKIPNHPSNLLASSGKYGNCGSTDEFTEAALEKKSIEIDYGKFALIENSKKYYPTHTVDWPIVNGGIPHGSVPFLTPLGKSLYFFPSRDMRPDFVNFSQTLFYPFPIRPRRFKLESPPLYVKGIEIPMPVCFFEPFNLYTNRFVDD